jgi:hypothetical protein
MIAWTIGTPSSPALEAFVYPFRDRKFSETLLNDCDLAFIPLEVGSLNLVVPRSPGSYELLMEVWHLTVTPYYPYTDIIVTPTGYSGITAPSGDPLRCRSSSKGVESISIYPEGYQEFLDFARGRQGTQPLTPWFVSQPDGTKRFAFAEPSPTTRHLPLTLDQDYHPEEYLTRGT